MYKFTNSSLFYGVRVGFSLFKHLPDKSPGSVTVTVPEVFTDKITVRLKGFAGFGILIQDIGIKVANSHCTVELPGPFKILHQFTFYKKEVLPPPP